MLTPDEIEALGNRVQTLLDPVTDFLIADITQRVAEAGQITGTAAYQVWRLQNLGTSREEIYRKLEKNLNLSRKQLDRLIEESAEAGYNFDLSRLPHGNAVAFRDSRQMQDIVTSAVKLGGMELQNITRTMGVIAPDGVVLPITEAYQKLCDFAFMQVSTGAADCGTAVRNAVRQLVNKGVQFIDYESDRHFSVESAIRRNIMGVVGNMQENISRTNHDELGADGWEISAHSCSAPDHEPIQGKQYTDEEYRKLNESLVRRIGTLNCGHAAYPIIIGVSRPVYSGQKLKAMREKNEDGRYINGRHYTGYEATQKQRDIETAIRKQKRKVMAEEQIPGSDQLDAARSKLNVLSGAYRKFSRAAGLPVQWERTFTTVPGAKY